LHRHLADFGKIPRVEQPFTAVQSKAKFADRGIITNYEWHCLDDREAISSSYGCHLKVKIAVHSSKLWVASKKSLILRSSNFLPTLF
jgi:hypothetical protein